MARRVAVEGVDPLKRLMDLASLAEQLECQLYARPCARTALPEACRDTDRPADQAIAAGCAAVLNGWCDSCRHWWLQHQVTNHLMRCVRIERDLRRAKEQSHLSV